MAKSYSKVTTGCPEHMPLHNHALVQATEKFKQQLCHLWTDETGVLTTDTVSMAAQ
jgi:hypothetical protein